MSDIKKYMIKNYSIRKSNYNKFINWYVGERLIVKKFLENHQKVEVFIDGCLKNLKSFKHDEWPDNKFYIKPDGGYVLDYNTKNGELRVSYYSVVFELSDKYSLKNSDIQLLMKTKVEEAFKLKVVTTIFIFKLKSTLVEEAFKLKVVTTQLFLESVPLRRR